MFPIAYHPFFLIIKYTVKCHSTHLSCMNICQKEQVFSKLQIRKLLAPALRERCSGRRSDRIDMRRCATQDGGNMSLSDTNIIFSPLTLSGQVRHNQYKTLLFSLQKPKHLLLSTALFLRTVELLHPCHP